MTGDWLNNPKLKAYKDNPRDAWYLFLTDATLSTKVNTIIQPFLKVKQYIKNNSINATVELGNRQKLYHPNWASYKCYYFATGNHNDKTTLLGDWLSILDFLKAEEGHISFYMSAKKSTTSSERDTNAHMRWYNSQVLTLAEKDNFIYKILFYMKLLPTWDDSTDDSIAKLLQEKFPPADVSCCNTYYN